MPKPAPKAQKYGAAFKPARRPPLHRDRVVDEAIAILDGGGPDALTFRRLAGDLDVGVATLYWHVDNKDVLLQLALDRVLGEIEVDAAHAEEPWEDRLREWLVQFRRVLRRHPWAAALAVASVERGPNLLRHWDRGAVLLLDAGFDEREVFYGLSTLFTYAIGVGVQDAIWHAYDTDDQGAIRRATLAQATEFFESLDADVYPSFRRLTPVIAAHDEEEQFMNGLALLITGLRAQLAEHPDRRTSA